MKTKNLKNVAEIAILFVREIEEGFIHSLLYTRVVQHIHIIVLVVASFKFSLLVLSTQHETKNHQGNARSEIARRDDSPRDVVPIRSLA